MSPAMFICRVFHCDRPFEQIDSRPLAEGDLSVGRDSDWSLPDPDRVLSRTHLLISVREGKVFVLDRSTNGAYLPDGRRIPRDEPFELAVRDTLSLGNLTLLIDAPSSKPADPAVTLAAPPPAPRRDVSLIEAFCEGAKLEASSLSSEEPQEVMRRVGEIYRQTVADLATLMAERARTRQDHSLDRTTIGASANNPFKWTAPRKLAQDLLLDNGASFLSGADAVRASFEDLADHLRDLTQQAEQAVASTLQSLAPDSIESEARSQGSLLRSKQALCWDILVRRYDAMTEATSDRKGRSQRMSARAPTPEPR